MDRKQFADLVYRRSKGFRQSKVRSVVVGVDGSFSFGTIPVGENRLVREYGAGQFAVVEFCREKDSIAGAVANLKALQRGVDIGGKTFRFLCASASQLREGAATFTSLNPDDVRQGIGDLSGEKNPAKMLARYGQVLSTTIPTVEIADFAVTDDIERDGKCFTDGCGVIGMELAKEVSRDLGLSHVPSVLHVRFAGAKGTLLVEPHYTGLQLRKSMVKFESAHQILEVCGWSKPNSGRLNSQFIQILEGRGNSGDSH